jgi:hypothetical protein
MEPSKKRWNRNRKEFLRDYSADHKFKKKYMKMLINKITFPQDLAPII